MIQGKRTNHDSLRRSFGFALQGFRMALRDERNIKVMLAAGAAAIILGLIVKLDFASWVIVLICCGLVISAELINTCVETIVDLVSPEYHPLAGRAKDTSAAAVYWLCIFVGIVGVMVFVRAIFFR